MEFALGWITLFLAAAIVTLVVWQVRTGRHPIVSARNFFFAGFIVYQLTSGSIAFFTQQYWEVPLANPEATGILYVLWCTIFLVVFLAAYHTGWFTLGLPKLLAKPSPAPAPATMMSLALGFLVLGYAMRLGFQYVPVIGVLGTMTGVTLAVAAAGVACWVWAKQLFNPTRAAFAMTIFGAATALAIFRTFGRRDLVSVAIACLWGAYHGHFKKQDLRRMALPFAGVALAGLLVIAAYTSVRSHESKEQGFVAQLSALANADIKFGLVDIFAGQGTAPISMWLMESRPDSFEYDTLHSLRYTFLNIIPREWWSGKLSSLGLDMVPQAGISNKGTGFTVGPGLMGHIANDNPYICLVLYPLLLGAFLRILDEMVAREPDNLFVVIPVGVALGEIVAIPRGELGLFTFRTILAVVAAYIGMRVVAKLLVGFGLRYNVAIGTGEGGSESAQTADRYGDSSQALGLASESNHEPGYSGSPDQAGGAVDAGSVANADGAAQATQDASRPSVPWGLQRS
ncbi:MAG: hypothetical protein U0640_04350 [Phycisphaerales bacterium]